MHHGVVMKWEPFGLVHNCLDLFSPHLCIDSKHNLHFEKISEKCMSFSKFLFVKTFLKANFHDLLMEKS